MKVKNLLSHFPKTVEWSLVVNIGLAVLASFYVSFHQIFLSWFLFALLFVFIYYYELGERTTYVRSFFSLFLLLVLWAFRSDETFLFGIIFALGAGLGIALWFFLVRFLVRNKERTLSFFHTILIYFAFLYATTSSGAISGIISACVTGILLFEDCTHLKFPWRKRILLISGAVSFFLFEGVLIIRSLPLDVIGGAGILTLIAVSIRNMVVAHFSGNLHQRYILEQTIAFVGLFIVILMTGHWIM